MSKHSLWVRDAVSETLREANADEIINAARDRLARRMRQGALLESPGRTRDFLLVQLAERTHEAFCLIHLDLCGAAAYVKAPRLSAEIA